MFAKTLPKFVGPDKTASWHLQYGKSVDALKTIDKNDPKRSLGASLELWENANAALKAESKYHVAEKYCLQQSSLWQIFEAFTQQAPSTDIKRTIINRAKKVLTDTPKEGCPLDLTFQEGKNTTQKTLDHLRDILAFYTKTMADANNKPANASGAVVTITLPLANDDFDCTWVIHPTDKVEDARKWLAAFLADNKKGRIITLGNDTNAQKSADISDALVSGSAGTIGPGRCLWIQNQAVLLPELAQWLKGAFDPAMARSIFVRPSGVASDIVKNSDSVSAAVISNKWTLAHP